MEARSDQLRDGKKRYCDLRKHSKDWYRNHAADPTKPYRAMRPTWQSWQSMKGRCLYTTDEKSVRNYSGRGIKVCDRWQNFEAFLADMGERPSREHSIERVDVNGDYEPGNCVWATLDQQSANRRDTVWIGWRGERRKFIEVCREVGADSRLARSRLHLGWDVDRALLTGKRVATPKVKKGTPSGPPRSAVRIEAARLFRLGWSFDAVRRKTGASKGTVRNAERDAKKAG